MASLKIPVPPLPVEPSHRSGLSSGRSRREEEALSNVHEIIKHMPRLHLDKVNNSIMKRLSDQSYAQYNKTLDLFLNKAASK